MLRKGDMVRWSEASEPEQIIGIALEEQKHGSILVYWLDDGKTTHEPIQWIRPMVEDK